MCSLAIRPLTSSEPGCFESKKIKCRVTSLTNNQTVNQQFLKPTNLKDFLYFYRQTTGENNTIPSEEAMKNQIVLLVYLNNIFFSRSTSPPTTASLSFVDSKNSYRYDVILQGFWDPAKAKFPITQLSHKIDTLSKKKIVVTSTVTPDPKWIAWDRASHYSGEEIMHAQNEMVTAFGCSSFSHFTSWDDYSCKKREYLEVTDSSNERYLTPPAATPPDLSNVSILTRKL